MLKTAAIRSFFFFYAHTVGNWIKEKAGTLTKDELIKRYKNSKSYTKFWSRTANVAKGTTEPQRFDPKNIMNFVKTKWGKRTMYM